MKRQTPGMKGASELLPGRSGTEVALPMECRRQTGRAAAPTLQLPPVAGVGPAAHTVGFITETLSTGSHGPSPYLSYHVESKTVDIVEIA